jgi:hypothetical protein
MEIVVPDAINRRLTYFSLEGEFIKSISLAVEDLMTTKLDSQGNIIGMTSVRSDDIRRYELKKFDPDLNFLFTIATSPLPDATNFDPFMATLRWELDRNDHVICGYPVTYEIKVFNIKGDLVKKVNREYDPIEVSQEDIEGLEEFPPSIKMNIPKYHNAYRLVSVDEHNRLFVMTWERTPEGDGYYYDIFDPEGKYIAKMPFSVRPRVWKKEKLYTIEEDEDGYQRVVRYRVTWKI